MASAPGPALIRYVCDRPQHAKRGQRYTLTIHEGHWAFCPHEGPPSEHAWRQVPGVQLAKLLERHKSPEPTPGR